MKSWTPMKVSVVGAVTETVLGAGRRSGGKNPGRSRSRSRSKSSWSGFPR